MKDIRNSIRQILRMPVRSMLFLCLLALSMCLFSMGVHLWSVNHEQMRILEESFTTVATVRQEPSSMKTGEWWDATNQTYRFFDGSVYDVTLPLSVLDLEGVDYIHPPEKRPYYGAYNPDLVITDNDELMDSLRVLDVIIEVQPYEDCVPSGPTRVKVVKVLYGQLSAEDIFFCDHDEKEPKPMFADKTYVMWLTPGPLTVTHPDRKDLMEEKSWEYLPIGIPSTTQYNKNGERIADTINSDAVSWEEVTEDFYQTPRGKRWLEIIEFQEHLRYTIPVRPTNSTDLLMSFYNDGAIISEGRDITDEEYRLGKQVCLIPDFLANNNNLSVGDELTLPLYFANYRTNTKDNFAENGAAYANFGYLNAQGKSYSVFDSSTYTIVGIYDRYGLDFDLADNEVIVPFAAIKNSDENNISDYGPMQAYNTSFQIPNGTIDTFMEEWNKQGITNLDIQFFDKGYSKLKAGFDTMRNVSLVLLLSGAATTLLLLVFFTFLFISKQKKRTAIERSLGLSKLRCGLSLFIGMMLIVLIGGCAGIAGGYLFSDKVQERVVAATREQPFDTEFSNWASNVDAEENQEVGVSEPDPVSFAIVWMSATLVAILVVSIGIHGNLRSEPLTMLSARTETNGK